MDYTQLNYFAIFNISNELLNYNCINSALFRECRSLIPVAHTKYPEPMLNFCYF